MSEAKVGDVAVCRNKLPGLITKLYNSENGVLYIGIQLSPSKLGRPWQTSHPTVIGNINSLLVLNSEGLLVNLNELRGGGDG